MVTFAVMGHNEARTVANAVGQAAAAAGPGDRLWFVDSDSTDGSAEIAASLGAEVVRAPRGKGRAMAAAIARCDTPHICFVDADLDDSAQNIPLRLREALAEDSGADMIVADLDWRGKPFPHAVIGVYRPLVGALFPEVLERFGRFPFSGFRLLRTDLSLGSLPPGFGVETYLNLLSATNGMRTKLIDVGIFHGAVRVKLWLGREVGDAILDLAAAEGRLDPDLRPRWDGWLDDVMRVLLTQPGPGEPAGDYPDRLMAAAARPLPPAS